MSGVSIVEPRAAWAELTAASETFTCYSAALAAWSALGSADWAASIDTGLRLTVVEAGELLFGFSHFDPGLGGRLRLARRSADDADAAAAGILDELASTGRVVVAGDGFNLPWHVAHGRRHVPHWFVLADGPDGPLVVDPFTCRNDLGLQEPTLHAVSASELAALAPSVPLDDPVASLREAFALGADDRPLAPAPFRWLVHASPAAGSPPDGVAGAAALRRLAAHFREHALEPDAYRQGDDLWSIARHRSFHAGRVAAEAAARGVGELAHWVDEQLAPLVARWGHVAPLLMQATLTLASGRTPTASLPDTLLELADREQQAAETRPPEVP